MDGYEFVIILLAMGLLFLVAFFAGAIFVVYSNDKAKKERLRQCDEVCEKCAFYCPDCGCSVDDCRPYDANALFFDGEAERLNREAHVQIEGADFVVKGKPKKYGE
jgi:hypothetical protein